MATKGTNPQTLRAVLIVLLVVIVAGGAGLFYLGLKEVRAYAVEVNHSITDAEASKAQIQQLQDLKAQLAQSETSIAKANQMFATPANYQNQAISDIRTYAAATGITVTKIGFDPVAEGVSPTATVSLKAPVSYNRLIQFLDKVEGNLPKMQVSSISVSHTVGGNADAVTVSDIKLTIATR